MTGIVAQNVGRPSGLIKSVAGGGVWTLIKTLTSDGSDDDLSFVNGASDVVLDSTYPIYKFVFINIHPEDQTYFSVNFSDDGGSNYDLAKTSSSFLAFNRESGASTFLAYRTGYDLAQGTGIQPLGGDTMSNDADNGGVGFMYLFSPSSTVFVKHFMSRFTPNYQGGYAHDGFAAGYVNTTAAVTAVQFKMYSGEIQGGKIKLYGLKDSA